MESERRCRQISGLTSRNHRRLTLRIRLLIKSKSKIYTELMLVDVADIWRERFCSYPRRSHRCGGNSDSIADIVTTNCEKSAEVIVPTKVGKDRTLVGVSK